MVWDEFRTFILFLRTKFRVGGVPAPFEADVFNNAYFLCNQYECVHVYELFGSTEYAKCSDPRDRCYALLSLVSSNVKLEPDYSLWISDVYIDLTRSYIKATQNLNIFSLMNFDNEESNLPSWIVPFNSPNPYFNYGHLVSQAVGNSATVDIGREKEVLRVIGVEGGVIRIVEGSFGSTPPHIRELCDLIRMVMGSTYIPWEEDAQLSDLCWNLNLGIFAETFLPEVTAYWTY
jgi:hypothetical protein